MVGPNANPSKGIPDLAKTCWDLGRFRDPIENMDLKRGSGETGTLDNDDGENFAEIKVLSHNKLNSHLSNLISR
jgi:hypothetical protein